jgi:hypothetical protein
MFSSKSTHNLIWNKYYVIAASAKQHGIQGSLLKTSEFSFMKCIVNKFSEELIAYFPFIQFCYLIQVEKKTLVYMRKSVK